MAKTINKDLDIYTSFGDIDVYTSLERALSAFNKSKMPCMLLKSTFLSPIYYLDRSKTAFKEWPNHYRLIAEK